MPDVYVGPRVRLGADCVLHPGARVGERVVLGDRVIVHHNASLGADGFGYFHDGAQQQKIPQKGTVVIEDDVEIGANTCVDRATFGRTVIGAGTKIDNLVQIGHNCLIGKRCIIISQVGMSGSVVIGDDCVIAARAAFVQHVRVGNGCVIGPSAGVKDDLPDGAHVGGFIAKDLHDWGLEIAGLNRLPAALKELARLRARLEKLEKESS
jgi:UDP-3-O-[3-hydroxymyristoyl] glucosamine N-acyltransferase